jgi:hypothetical protein
MAEEKGVEMIKFPICPLCKTRMMDGSINTTDDVYIHLTMNMCPDCYCKLLSGENILESVKKRIVSELGIESYWEKEAECLTEK